MKSELLQNEVIKVLDCTLRDGGYYNNWDFDQDAVEVYLQSMADASVDVVEIGFRSLPKKTFKGPFFYSLDDNLETLSIPNKLQIAVMINAKEFFVAPNDPKNLINKLFQPAILSPVDLVRIAVNFDDALRVEILAKELKALGYKVGLNLMQANGKKSIKYKKTVGRIAAWESIDVLYFADSLGSMYPNDVSFICKSIRSVWNEPLGIHTHNNKGLALINSLTAIEAGVRWCDSTVLGMGRGAGNVNTEALLIECNTSGSHSGNAKYLISCNEHFETLKRTYQWGPNLHYHYAASHNIHPTFVQSLINDTRYKPDQIASILESLAQKRSTSFSKTSLQDAINQVEVQSSEGSWDATGWLKGRNVLIVGAGPSVFRYRNAIINYIKRHKPAVIFLNINDHLPSELGDATLVAHGGRASFDTQRYRLLEHPLIMPSGRLIQELGGEIEGLNIREYGLSVQDGAFKIGSRGCILQWPLAFAYALSVATQASANEIQLVGFDGYNSIDIRQKEMNEVISAYGELQNCLPLKSLTPTNYQISQGSIFEPQIKLDDFVVIIPARYQSGRFPGKPLADLCGKSLIRRVWDKCVQAVGAGPVLVATDDKRIQMHCLEQGMNVTMTSSECLTGTDRICEVAQRLERDIYINVQGDEPLIDPNDILNILKSARRYTGSIINGMCPILDEQDFRSANVPKVVAASNGRLMYMSRAAIPTGKKSQFDRAMRQVCIYALPRKAILNFGRYGQKAAIENIEDIEILRFLEMGYTVRMVEVEGSSVAVDTEEDLYRARKIIGTKSLELQASY